MSKLSELVHFKELWEARKENAEKAIAYFTKQITIEVSKEENQNEKY